MANDLMDYYQQGSQVGARLAQVMQKRRTDAIANELLGQRDGRAHSGGADELKMQLLLEHALNEKQLREAQTVAARAKAAAPGVASRPARTLTPEEAAHKLSLADKYNREPQMAAYRSQLGAYEKERSAIEKDLMEFEDSLSADAAAKTGQPIEVLAAATNTWRGDKDGNSMNNLGETGAYAHLNTPKGRVSMKWTDYQGLLGRYNELQTKRKRLEQLQAPAPFSPAQSSTEASGNEPEQAAAQMPTVGSVEEARKLRSGTQFLDPNGVLRVVP